MASSVHESAVIAGKFARKDNRARESMVKSEPKFKANRDQLITATGRSYV